MKFETWFWRNGALLVLILEGCNPSNADDDATAGAGGGASEGADDGAGGSVATGAAGGDGTSSDAGGSDGGDTSGGGGDTNGTGGSQGADKWGVVIVNQTVQVLPFIGTLVASGAVATFGLGAGENTCDVTRLGDCELYECETDTATETGTTENYEAGDVTITGLAADIQLVFDPTLTSYMSPASSSLLWTTSQEARVTVSGSSSVPAFTLDLIAPNPISVTAPTPGSDSTYAISRATALEVTWSGGVEGFVTTNLSSQAEEGIQVTIGCVVDAAEGRVTVPASFMEKLGSSGGFAAGVTSVETTNVQDWLMQFQASTLQNVGTATFTD